MFSVEWVREGPGQGAPKARALTYMRSLQEVYFFWSFVFLGPHPRHVEVPRPGDQSELWLLAYTTAMAMPDPSHIRDLHHSLFQCWILNPLSEARD